MVDKTPYEGYFSAVLLNRTGEKPMEDVVVRTEALVREVLGPGSDEEVNPEQNFFDDLGMDSLDLVELIIAAENEFKISITDEDADRMETVQDLIDHVKTLKAAA